MNVDSPQLSTEKPLSEPRSAWHPVVFFDPFRLSETIAHRPKFGPIIVWGLVSWALHEPQWMSRLGVRLLDSHLYALPTFLQGLMQHALPWLLGFAALAMIFHYRDRAAKHPSLSLESRWLATSSLWGLCLCLVALMRLIVTMTELSPDPFRTTISALHGAPSILSFKVLVYVLGFGLIAWSSAKLATSQGLKHPTTSVIRTALMISMIGSGLAASGYSVQRDWATLRPLQVLDPAPDFNLRHTTGPERLTRDRWIEKDGLTLIDFWATWCEPCKVAMPQIAALHEEFGDQGFRVLSVNIEADDPISVREFLKDHPAPYEVWLDDDRMAARYDVSLYPTFILLEGAQVVGIFEGLPGLLGAKRLIQKWMDDQGY